HKDRGRRTNRKVIVAVKARNRFEHCINDAENLRRKAPASPEKKQKGPIFPLKQIPGIAMRQRARFILCCGGPKNRGFSGLLNDILYSRSQAFDNSEKLQC